MVLTFGMITLKNLEEISQKKIPQEDIEKTIVVCYGDAIVPASPKDRGARAFESLLYGNPVEFKQLRVNNIFKVTSEDVQKADQKYYESAVKEKYQSIFCDKSKKISGNKIKISL